MQVAADPEHPNKHPGTPPPLTVRVSLLSFEETAERKRGRAAACRGQTFLKRKINLFLYEIYRPFD